MAKKTNPNDDFRSLDDQALTDRISEEELRMKKMQFTHAINPIENPMGIRAIRRGLAQMKTEVTKRKSSVK